MKLYLKTESLKLTEALGEVKVHGIAIHPISTYHPEDWAEKRVYFEEELKKAVPSLIGKPLFLNHRFPLNGCKVVNAKWDERESGVYFEAVVTPYIADKIRSGQIRKVSISVNPWRKGGGVKFVNGIAPFGFEFNELSLLENLDPGDDKAWIELTEAMRSPEFLIYRIKDVEKISRMRYAWIDIINGIQGVYVSPVEENSYDLYALLFGYDKGWSIEKIMEWLSHHPQYSRPKQSVVVVVTQPEAKITESKITKLDPVEREERSESPLARARKRMRRSEM